MKEPWHRFDKKKSVIQLRTISRQICSRLEKPFNLKTAEISQFLLTCRHFLHSTATPAPPLLASRRCIFAKRVTNAEGGNTSAFTTCKRAWTYLGRGRNTAVSFRLRKASALSSGMLSGDVEKRKLSSGSSNIILRISIKCKFLSFSSKQKKTLD